MIIYSPNCNSSYPYCVYITFYSGNQLPPFYIGSGKVSKIESGYRGSVGSKEFKDKFKSELVNHPEKFKIFIIQTFEFREAASEKESNLQRQLNIGSNPMYINKAYWHGHLKYTHSDEHKISMSLRPGGMLGKTHSAETKQRMSESHKGKKKPDGFSQKISNLMSGRLVSTQTKQKLIKYTWKIKTPDGHIEDIEVLSDWCKQYNFKPDNVRKCFQRFGSYKGFVVI